MVLNIIIGDTKKIITISDINDRFQQYFTTASGLTTESNFNLTLYDYFDQPVISDSSSVAEVTILPGQGKTASLSKNTKVKAENGIYKFDDFILTS